MIVPTHQQPALFRHDKLLATGVVHIVAGGPSSAKLPLKELKASGFVLGVNESSLLYDTHAGLTMDRLWAQNRQEEMVAAQKPYYIRHTVYPKLTAAGLKQAPLHSVEMLFDGVGPSEPGEPVHGDNSGRCALDLALQQRAVRVIYLYGFDMGSKPREQHWHADYAWSKPTTGKKYEAWRDSLSGYRKVAEARGVQVYNVSPRSAIKEFQKISVGEVLKQCGGES